MSERYERLVEAINVTAEGCTRLKMKLNSQDPRIIAIIINAREAITTAHKALDKKKCKVSILYISKKGIR